MSDTDAAGSGDFAAVDKGMILDLFAGPGGWSEGLRMLGLSDVGIEWDESACLTRAAAGHLTIRADVSQVPEVPFMCRVDGLIASPPCQAFSAAGKRKGADLLPELCDAVRRWDWDARPDPDPQVWLVLDVGRWITRLRPEWVALEQVKEVLPIWREYAVVLRTMGYSVATAVVNAANYGVPQTRKRAVLLASRVRQVQLPEPTHSSDAHPGLFGTNQPWVAMEDVLDLSGVTALRYDRGAGMNERHGERPDTPASSPAPTITCSGVGGGAGTKFRWVISTGDHSYKHSRLKADAVDYERAISEPSPTVLGAKFEGAWFVHEAGQRDEAIAGDAPMVRLTLDEAAALQTFPRRYPFKGTKGKRAEQIGNAVPPLLAAHLIAAVIGCGQPQEVAA